jgi:hypothetical protein
MKPEHMAVAVNSEDYVEGSAELSIGGRSEHASMHDIIRVAACRGMLHGTVMSPVMYETAVLTRPAKYAHGGRPC